jgi:multidrug resistance efflux pump
MNEELIDTLNNQIKDLNRQVAQKDATIEANKKKLEKYNELAERIVVLEKENTSYKAQIDGLTPKAEAFAKIEDDMKADALTRAFGEDEEAKSKFKDLPLDKIEELAAHRETYKPASGVGANNVEDPIAPQPTPEEPTAAETALEFYKKTHNGETPSFLKEEGGQ